MSKEKIVCVNELTIRFEQLEGVNSVNWSIIPDEIVEKTQDASLMDLAEYGAPLSVIAIHALWKMCSDGLIFTSLETANAIKNGIAQRMAQAHEDIAMGIEVEDLTMH